MKFRKMRRPVHGKRAAKNYVYEEKITPVRGKRSVKCTFDEMWSLTNRLKALVAEDERSSSC